MAANRTPDPAPRLLIEWALDPRGAGRLGGLLDCRVVAAAAAGVPVWWVLALTMGPRMAVPTGAAGWLWFVLLGPWLEEIVFRGAMQGELLRWTRGRALGPLTVANLATTAAFVALHLRAQDAAWALAVAVPSLVLGVLRERLRSVWPGALLHAWYNGGFALAALWTRPGAG